MERQIEFAVLRSGRVASRWPGCRRPLNRAPAGRLRPARARVRCRDPRTAGCGWARMRAMRSVGSSGGHTRPGAFGSAVRQLQGVVGGCSRRSGHLGKVVHGELIRGRSPGSGESCRCRIFGAAVAGGHLAAPPVRPRPVPVPAPAARRAWSAASAWLFMRFPSWLQFGLAHHHDARGLVGEAHLGLHLCSRSDRRRPAACGLHLHIALLQLHIGLLGLRGARSRWRRLVWMRPLARWPEPAAPVHAGPRTSGCRMRHHLPPGKTITFVASDRALAHVHHLHLPAYVLAVALIVR